MALTNQQIRDAGYEFISPIKYLQHPFVLPTIGEDDEEETQSSGITNTNAFTQSGDGGGGGSLPLDLTYDPKAVATTSAASVNNLLQAKGDPIHIKGYETPALGTEMHGYPNRTVDYVVPGTSGISEAKFPPGIMEIANYDEVFGDKTVVDPITGKTHTLPAPERFSFPEDDEEKESWYSGLFRRTPKVRKTLGTRLANAPRLPLPAAMASWSFSPFNPKSRNWNPQFEGQLNYLEGLDGYIGIDPGTGHYRYGPESVLSGKNVISFGGTNDYEEALNKYINKMNERGLRKKLNFFQTQKLEAAQKELENWQNQNQKNIDEKIAIEKERAATAPQRREGRGATHMSRSIDQGGLGLTTTDAAAVSKANRESKYGSTGWGLAEGGRAGYNRGRVVNPGGYAGDEEGGIVEWLKSIAGPESESNPTAFGTQDSLINRASIGELENVIKSYEALMMMGDLDEDQLADYELKLSQLQALREGTEQKALGGRAGFFYGGLATIL